MEFFNDFTHKKPYTRNSLIEQTKSEAIQIEECYSSTLYKDFALNLFQEIHLILLI